MCCSTVHWNVLQLRGEKNEGDLERFFSPLSLLLSDQVFSLCLWARFHGFFFFPFWCPHARCSSSDPCGIEVTLSKSKWLFIHTFSREIVYPCGMCTLHLRLIPGQNFIRSFASHKKKNAERAKGLLPGTPEGTFPTSFGFISCIFLIREHRERVWRGKVIEQTSCLSHWGRLNQICYC